MIQITTCNLKIEKDFECCICLYQTSPEINFECPICGHEFHASCLRLALANEQRCPLCMKHFQINELRLIYWPYKYENVRNIEELEEKIETLENENSIMTIMLIQFDKDKS